MSSSLVGNLVFCLSHACGGTLSFLELVRTSVTDFLGDVQHNRRAFLVYQTVVLDVSWNQVSSWLRIIIVGATSVGKGQPQIATIVDAAAQVISTSARAVLSKDSTVTTVAITS